MVYSAYQKQRILSYYDKGFKALTIAQLLRDEKLRCNRVGVAKFQKRFRKQAASAGGLDLGDHQR